MVSKKRAAWMMEWMRPAGIGLAVFFAYYSGKDEISRYHQPSEGKHRTMAVASGPMSAFTIATLCEQKFFSEAGG
jgi:hypothetical protein